MDTSSAKFRPAIHVDAFSLTDDMKSSDRGWMRPSSREGGVVVDANDADSSTVAAIRTPVVDAFHISHLKND